MPLPKTSFRMKDPKKSDPKKTVTQVQFFFVSTYNSYEWEMEKSSFCFICSSSIVPSLPYVVHVLLITFQVLSSKSVAFTEKVKAAVNKRQYCPWTFWWIELTHEFCGGGNGACTVDFFNPRKHNSKFPTIIVFDIVIWVKGKKSISKVVKSHRLLVKL